MVCSRCGHRSPDDARFCGECGAPLERDEAREPGAYRPFEYRGEADGDEPASEGEPRPTSDIPERGLGQLIGEAFSVYGRAFFTLFIIALVIQIPWALGLVLGQPIGDAGDISAAQDPQFDFSSDVLLPLLSFLLSIPSTAAAVFCVAQTIRGRRVDVVTCYYRAFGVLLPATAVTIVVTLALAGSAILMVVIIGIPLFFYLLVVWFFAIPVVVIEGMGGIAALGRSRQLTRGSWWRLFGIGIVFVLLMLGIAMAGALVSAPLLFVDPRAFAIAAVALGALVTPIYYAGSVLVYLDLRVRKEGYTLQALSDDLVRRPEQAR